MPTVSILGCSDTAVIELSIFLLLIYPIVMANPYLVAFVQGEIKTMSMGVNTAAIKKSPSAFAMALKAGFRAHVVFYLLIVVYYAFDLAYLEPDPGSFALSILLSVVFGPPMLLFAIFMLRVVIVATTVRPENPTKAIGQDIWSILRDRRRLACGLPMFASYAPMMVIFGEFKAAVPVLGGGFTWDQTFSDMDRWLHFGRLPWEWLHPILGYAPITFLINFNYNYWFFVMWMVWASFAFATKPSEERTQFLLSFMLLWSIAGSFLAIYFASAGPAYFTRIGLSPDPYIPLMNYLYAANETVPVWALGMQELLWEGFNGRTVVDGISAMPSMHNASALLFVLAGRHFGKLAYRLLFAHMVLIYIGSVHLAWHYAVDAYLGWAAALVIWYAAKPIARWWHARPESLEFAEAVDALERTEQARIA